MRSPTLMRKVDRTLASEFSSDPDLQDVLLLDYDQEQGLGLADEPHPEEFVPSDEIAEFLNFIHDLPESSRKAFINAVKSDYPELYAQFLTSTGATQAEHPEKWSARKTGRDVSPVDWIKTHYGNKQPERWDPMGLSRADLRHDPALIAAYDRSIERHPDRALPGLEPEQRVRLSDPEAVLERRLSRDREAKKVKRKSLRL